MKNFYKSLLIDTKNLKKRVTLITALITAIYLAVTFGLSSPNSVLQTVSVIVIILTGIAMGVITITTPQHGIRNQKSIIYFTFTIVILLILTAIQGFYAISQGDGLIEQSFTRDSFGNMITAKLTFQPIILMIILATMWVTSLEISNKIEHRQKTIKGIQNTKLFK